MGLFCFELYTNCWSDIWFIVWIFYFSLNYGMRSHVDHILFLSLSVFVSLCPCILLSHSHLHSFGQSFLLFVSFVSFTLCLSLLHTFFLSHSLSACFTHSFTVYLALFHSLGLFSVSQSFSALSLFFRSLTIFSLSRSFFALSLFFRPLTLFSHSLNLNVCCAHERIWLGGGNGWKIANVVT